MKHTHHGYNLHQHPETITHDHVYADRFDNHDHPEIFLAIYHDEMPPADIAEEFLYCIEELERILRKSSQWTVSDRTRNGVELHIKLEEMYKETQNHPELELEHLIPRLLALKRAVEMYIFNIETTVDEYPR